VINRDKRGTAALSGNKRVGRQEERKNKRMLPARPLTKFIILPKLARQASAEESVIQPEGPHTPDAIQQCGAIFWFSKVDKFALWKILLKVL
jgi:hypothetical protein